MIEIKQPVRFAMPRVSVFPARWSIRRVRRLGEINLYHTLSR